VVGIDQWNPVDRKMQGFLHLYSITPNKWRKYFKKGGIAMAVYKIVELVGTSTKSWEDAARSALITASKTLEDLRIAEVVKQDVTVDNGKITAFRVRLNLSFKYRDSD
jgi:flavin-binding protein dodecin